MASIPTKNAVPSENFDDLRFNSGKLDEFVTSSADSYIDRLGIEHLTARGLQNSVVGALLPANNLADLEDSDESLSNLGGSVTGIAVFKAGTQAAARAAISAAASGSNVDITEITGLAIALSIAQGGTGGKTALAARNNLGVGTLGTQNSSAVTITGGSISGINDLQISDGGTGASSAATARSNLGAKADAGVTDGSSAGAGQVGETISVTGSSVTITNATTASLCSLNLTPGDWEIDSIISLTTSAGATSITAGNSNSAAAIAPSPLRLQLLAALSTGTQNLSAPRRQFSLSASTTIYLNISVGFSSGTASGVGFMFARRIR